MYHAFQHIIETFPYLSVKCRLQNAPYFSFSPFQHWQVDNGNVLDSQSAAGDDIWEGEWAALLLHDRSPLQDQEADLNSLLKGPGQESYLRLSTAQYSAHQQNPDFSVHSGRGRMLHTALCLQVCICSGPEWHEHKLCQVYELSEHRQFFGETTDFQLFVSSLTFKMYLFFQKITAGEHLGRV